MPDQDRPDAAPGAGAGFQNEPRPEAGCRIRPATDSEARPLGKAAPPPPKICNGCNIFDCLAAAPLLLLFCLLSWSRGSDALGRYAFFRGGSASGAVLSMFTLLAAALLVCGLFLLYRRIRHGRYCARNFPKPKRNRGPSVWADLRDALDQMIGLKEFEGIDKEAARTAPKKRVPRDWLRREKTRIGLSAFWLALLMYLTPGFILLQMGTHVLVYFLCEFMAVMTALMMWLIAWVELGE